MKFYMGTHLPRWLEELDIPLFVSRRRLAGRKTFPRALAPWALDSGGFTELGLNGEWSITPAQYAAEVTRFQDEIGNLEFCAPMDWMVEPHVLAKTGGTVLDHQHRTCANFDSLRYLLGDTVIPVIQGWTPDDYLRHVDMYGDYAVNLEAEPVVGVGSVCRRNANTDILRVLRPLLATGLNLHAFGIRGDVLRAIHGRLSSADSMAWSFEARRAPALRGCAHRNCANCQRYALRWRERLLKSLDQLTLEVVA